MEHPINLQNLGFAVAPTGMSPLGPSQAPSPEPTPPASEHSAQTQGKHPEQHRRNYQACIPCRRRKVKCQLGPVDDPHDPPCRRCRREAKPCFFSATRRKRKADELEKDDEEVEVFLQGGKGFIRAKMPKIQLGYQSSYPTSSGFGFPPTTPGGGQGQSRPLKRPTSRIKPFVQSFDGEDEQKINTETAVRFQHGELYNNHDALDLLAETAVASGHTDRRRVARAASAPRQEFTGFGSGPAETPRSMAFLAGGVHLKTESEEEVQYQYTNAPWRADALAQWQKVRFVRSGWFTAVEGMRYVEYFYKHIYPLTPITLPDYQAPWTHGTLLRNEPMLAVTIMTIASRQVEPPTEGALLRGFAIHQRLWEFLQSMICRMVFGQDRLENNNHASSTTNSYRDRALGLRDLGAIESLLLLTEWHPSTIHFPTHDFSNGILIEESGPPTAPTVPASSADDIGIPGDAWRKSLYRSDNMTWSFIGIAVNLAYELGVFNGGALPVSLDPNRAGNVRRLLCVFALQASGRLSLPSMIPDQHWKTIVGNLDDVSKYIGKRASSEDVSESSTSHSPQLDEALLHFWIRITDLFGNANNLIWSSPNRARELVSQGNYAEILDKLTQEHQHWRHDLNVCTTIPSHFRHVLNLEYYYMRVHSNNIALQAVVDRCVNVAPLESDAVIRPEILEGCMGDDRKYLDMIRDDSKSLLDCVVNGLNVNGHLRHLSNRTHFRIANVAIILLKTLALGGYSDQVAECLRLLDQASELLADNAVDDLHIAAHLSELVQSMTGRIRSNMIRIPKNKGKARQQANTDRNDRGQSSSPTPQTLQPHPGIGPTSGFNPLNVPGPSSIRNNRSTGFGDRRGNIHRPSPLGQHVDLPQPSPLFQQHFALNNIPMYNPDGSMKALTPNGTRLLPDPLQGINPSATFDAQNPNVSLMPPPPSARSVRFSLPTTDDNPPPRYTATAGTQGLDPMMPAVPPTAGLTSWSDFYNQSPRWQNQDWVGMDLAPLSQAGGGDVRQSESGPMVGNQDMLDVLTPSNPNGPPRDWNTFNPYQ